MEKYLDAPVKEIIAKFPDIGVILEEYNIGCVPCTLGSCLLKDVVEIHNLPEEQEIELMYCIEKEIYPERNIKKTVPVGHVKKAALREINYPAARLQGIPSGKFVLRQELPERAWFCHSERSEESPYEILRGAQDDCGVFDRKIRFSPPIKRLIDEHAIIKKFLSLIPAIIEIVDVDFEQSRPLIQNSIVFISLYADKFHHAKEEDILFEYVDKNSDIVKTMHKDHETARNYVGSIRKAIEEKDKNSIIKNLNAYKDLLTEHIKKEDEILYPWIDRNFSISQVGKLFAKFDEAEKRMDKELIEEQRRFVSKTEQKLMLHGTGAAC